MTLVLNRRTRMWEGDYRATGRRRLHISFGLTQKGRASVLHDAVRALYAEGQAYPDLIERLRRRTLAPAAVAACVRDKRSFATLRVSAVWPTVAEAAKQYEDATAANPNRAANTVVAVRLHLKRFAAFEYEGRACGTFRVDELPAAAVDAYGAHMRQTATGSTPVDAVQRIGALYRWLITREEREARQTKRAPRPLYIPVDTESAPRHRPSRERWLTTAECDRLVAATPPLWRFAILCGLHAGLRAGEVTHLRPGYDVDEAHREIVIQARQGPPAWKPKGRRGKHRNRRVPMTDALWAAYLVQRDTYASSAWLVTNTRGDRLREDALWEHFKQCVVRARLLPGRREADGVVFHTLRHTFASHALMRGADIYTVAQLLGDTVATVERVYLHLARDHKREAVAQLATLGAAGLGVVVRGADSAGADAGAGEGFVTTSALTAAETAPIAQ